MLKSIYTTVAVAALSAGMATSASALSIGPVDVDYQGHNSAARVNVSDVNDGTPAYNGVAASFNMYEASKFGSFIAWCLDIGTYIKDSAYTFIDGEDGETFFSNAGSAVTIDNTKKSNIQKLFNVAYKGLDVYSATQAGGFQLALWELIYEEGGAFGLTTGSFQDSIDNAARTQADVYLGMLGDQATGNYKLWFMEAEQISDTAHKSQNLVFGTPRTDIPGVPVPAAAWLLASGIGAMGFGRLRRKAA